MILIMVWIIFVIFVSVSRKLNHLHYFLSSSFMLGLTYIYNQTNLINFPLRSVLGFLFVPSLFFWYIALVYNGFLALTPIDSEAFVSLVFIYLYVLFYIFSESS